MTKSRLIVGIHAVRESLKISGQSAKSLLLKDEWQSDQDLKQLNDQCRSMRVPVKVVSHVVLDRLSRSHQGVALETSYRPTLDWNSVGSSRHECLAALDGLTDPQNLGAILRTSWLLGVRGVLLPRDRSVQLTPTVSKIASGGAEHVPVEVVGSLLSTLKLLKEKEFWVIGLSGRGLTSLNQFRVPQRIVWVLGGEESGIRSTHEKVCDELVSIPQLDSNASYNASVALAMALYETRRQHLEDKENQQ